MFFTFNSFNPLLMDSEIYSTNNNGTIRIMYSFALIRLTQQNPLIIGRMTFQLNTGGFLSDPIDLFIKMPNISISIINQPSTLSYDSYKIWTKLPQPAVVRVTIEGNPIENVVVYPIVRATSHINGTLNGIENSKYIEDKDASIITNMDALSFSSNTTNSSGYATIDTVFSDLDSPEGTFM